MEHIFDNMSKTLGIEVVSIASAETIKNFRRQLHEQPAVSFQVPKTEGAETGSQPSASSHARPSQESKSQLKSNELLLERSLDAPADSITNFLISLI
jgi:hypothetical protein